MDVPSAGSQELSIPAPQAPPHCSEEALLGRAGAGDRAAFGTLYDRVAGAVYGLVQQIVVDPSAAERVTQDVLLAAWASAPSFDPSAASARGWILGMAHRHAVDEVREDDGATRPSTVPAAPPEPRAAPDAATPQPMAAGIEKALGCLSASQRSAVMLAYFHGLTYRHVARRLDISRSSAANALRDALRRLATQFDDPVG